MADTFINPIETPPAFDVFQLDGQTSPGYTLIKNGGTRKDKFEAQQAPGFAGAFTLFRGEEISGVTYEIIVWTPEGHTALQDYIGMLQQGRRQRPPKVWSLVDPRLSHNAINDVCVVETGPLLKIGPTKWSLTLVLGEFKKRRPTGGAPKRPRNDEEAAVQALSEENAALAAELDAAEAGVL